MKKDKKNLYFLAYLHYYIKRSWYEQDYMIISKGGKYDFKSDFTDNDGGLKSYYQSWFVRYGYRGEGFGIYNE